MRKVMEDTGPVPGSRRRLGVTLFYAVEGYLPFQGSAWPEPPAETT